MTGVSVIDPDHHLFTLQDDRDINVELYVNKGRGYVEADHASDSTAACRSTSCRIDSIYNPVRRANFTVAETRVGQRTDYDRLTLTVETNGTITPEEAVSLRRRARADALPVLRGVRQVPAPARRRRTAEGAVAHRPARACCRPIDDFGLSVRSVNSLKNSNIRTLGDLVAFRPRTTCSRSRTSARSR